MQLGTKGRIFYAEQNNDLNKIIFEKSGNHLLRMTLLTYF